MKKLQLPIPFIIIYFIFCSLDSTCQTSGDLYQSYLNSVQMVREQADYQLASAHNPIVRRHIQSAKDLVVLEQMRISVIGTAASDEQIIESKKYTDVFAKGLTDEIFDEDVLLSSGRRKMVISFLSPRDKSIQYYVLGLPKNFDPEVAYPLLVGLHGSGPSHPLFYPQIHFQPPPIDTDKRNNERDHISISPWGRGNAGYVEYAESDVWEALEDLNKFVSIDPKRIYLEGHSMGARGAWNLAVRKPDYWAGVALYSLPLSRRSSLIADLRYTRNLLNTPIYLWLGEKDRESYHIDAKNLITSLESNNCNYVFVSSPEEGHSPPISAKETAREWLFSQYREVPDNFYFLTNQQNYRGIWGIDLSYDLDLSVEQSMECIVKGNTVSLVTHGAKGISVSLGNLGLELQESCKLMWNGNLVYEGNAIEEPIAIGDYIQNRRGRR